MELSSVGCERVAEREVAFLKTPWRGTRVCWHHQKLGRLDQYKGEDVGLYVVALPPRDDATTGHRGSGEPWEGRDWRM